MSVDGLHVEGVENPVLIGQGGYGTVYRCQETDLDRPVAVKILSGQLDEVGKNRFERERRAMGVLAGHPNIVMVHRSGLTDAGRPYLVMEFLAGGSMADKMARSGPLPWSSVLEVGIEICGALETAHREGVLHRDIKPANLLESNLGVVKLGDFGIARMQGAPETRSAMITASIAHAAPEIIEGKRPDVLADVYSLGSTLFELLTGSPAHVRETDESIVAIISRVAQDPVPNLRPMGVPDVACRALESAMAKDSLARPGSAEAFGRALQAAQRSLGLTETPMRIEGERAVDLIGQPSPPTPQPQHRPQTTSHLPPPPTPTPNNQVSDRAPSVSGPLVPRGPVHQPVGYNRVPNTTSRPSQTPPRPSVGQQRLSGPLPPQMGPGAQAVPPLPRGSAPRAATPAPQKSAKVWLWATLAVLGSLLMLIVVVIAANRPNQTEATGTVTTIVSSPPTTVRSQTTSADDSKPPTSEIPEITVPATEVSPPPASSTVILPERPTVDGDIVFAGDYDEYEEISGDESLIRFEAPAEWADVRIAENGIHVSTDLNGLTSSYESSGVSVASTVLPIEGDPDAVLDQLPVDCFRVDERVDVALAGMTGRSIRVSGCGATGQTEVTYLALVSDDELVLMVIALQATDPRDGAAFTRILETFQVRWTG